MDIRADAWYSGLSESQQWQLYAIAKRTRNWAEVVQAARDNFQLEAEVSRSGFYRWRDKMRQADAEQRRLAVVAAQAEAASLAREHGISDEAAINALKALAIDAAMSDNSSEALKWANAAMSIKDRQQKDAELKLKSARQKTADDQLRLAREKFEAAEKRLAAMAELSDAARGGKVDPAKVADEIDRILGRKK